jgi:hypothetical protein
MLSRLDGDDAFLKHFFSDKATFNVSGKVNRHNCQIWESGNPHKVVKHECGTPKLNVWCALTSDFLIGPFIFEEPTVTGTLKKYAITQIP